MGLKDLAIFRNPWLFPAPEPWAQHGALCDAKRVPEVHLGCRFHKTGPGIKVCKLLFL